MEDIVPGIGDWVACQTKENLGKVIDVDLEKKMFRAVFYNSDEPEGVPSFDDAKNYPFSIIESIITDPDEIRQMEMDWNGF